MFSKLALIVTSACALAAVGAPTSTGGSTCTASGRTLQCCNTMEKASDMSYATSFLLGLLHIDPTTVTGDLGLHCSLSLVGGTTCTQQTVCCKDNKFSGLVVLGCSPVNVGI